MRKKQKEEISDEIKVYIELFYELFHQQSFEKAISYMGLLKYELKNFQRYARILKQKFLPCLQKIPNLP